MRVGLCSTSKVGIIVQWGLHGEVTFVDREQADSATGVIAVAGTWVVTRAAGNLECAVVDAISTVAFFAVFSAMVAKVRAKRLAKCVCHIVERKPHLAERTTSGTLQKTTLVFVYLISIFLYAGEGDHQQGAGVSSQSHRDFTAATIEMEKIRMMNRAKKEAMM